LGNPVREPDNHSLSRSSIAVKDSSGNCYPDKHHSWKSSGSFDGNETALAIYCLEKGLEHTIEQEKDEEAKETKINSQKRISLLLQGAIFIEQIYSAA